MKRFIIPFFTFAFAFALLSASAVTATKEYVDRQDAATLQTAKDYAAQKVAESAPGNYAVVSNKAMTALDRFHPYNDEYPEYGSSLRWLDGYDGLAFGYWSFGNFYPQIRISDTPYGEIRHIGHVNPSRPWSWITIGDSTDENTLQDALDAKADKADISATNKEVDKAKSSANEAKATANEANEYSVATYNFMNGNTNAWFAGTNYVFGADATNKHHFAFEDGMDLVSVPCSMALWENRDGARQLVWDQRDWTSWYWSFKAGQMRQEIAATNAEIYAAMTNYAPRAWSRMTAASGLENPDRSTTWIDTKNVTLSPGMAWETVATVDGCGYWTIVGNGAVIGGSGTNAVLTIRDFEGNDIMTVTKGEHRLAWLESSDLMGSSRDENGWVCFDMRADVQPTGYYSTTLEMVDFVAETDANCPAQYRWENMGGGVWRVHFLLKPGIVSAACFAKFLVEVEGQTIIRYNAGQEISGGLIYNGVKIAPDISGHPSAGTVIQWKVVN